MANYSGAVPNRSAYVKQFVYGSQPNLWKQFSYTPAGGSTINVLTPTYDKMSNLYLKGNLYVDGSIINPSDKYLKDNIESINNDKTNKLMNLIPSQFTFKMDSTKKLHYGFIAQDFENEYPELITIKPDNLSNIKAINYLEIIPLLVSKMQMMQKEIDELKAKIN
jgi:hypothetical protein